MKKSALWASALALTFALGGCTVTTYSSGNNPPPQNYNNGYNNGGGSQGWQKLGERTIDGNVDHDVIYVGNDRGPYSSVRFKAERSALEVYDLVITFNDNTTYRPPMRQTLNQNQTTGNIDLPGGRRYIARIDFHYRDLGGGRKGQLEAWGR
ncbi:MAG TPA: hypothetical protein VFS43_33270 [Polyangiaceae bacterium]|nr:hypothetical protein [Polyangiaceae bacterium]